MRRSVRLLTVLVVLALPAAALAAFAWNDPGDDVSDAGLYGPEGGAVAPDGTVLMFGWSNGGLVQVAVRPPSGPLGGPIPVGDPAVSQGVLNTAGKPPVVAFDHAGDGLIASPVYGQIVYRSASGAMTPPQNLGVYGAPKGIAMGPAGNAVVGFDQGAQNNGTVRVAARAAGADAQVDTAHAQAFTLPSGAGYFDLIGLQLDPTGAAIAVMQDKLGALYQSSRAAGGTFADPPVPIPNASGLSAAPSNVAFAGSRAGFAVLAYVSGITADPLLAPVAATRGPGGSFGTPETVGGKPQLTGVSAVLPAVDDDGDGVVAFTHEIQAAANGCPDGGRYGLYAAWLHGGHLSAAEQLETTDNDRSQLLRTAGAGHRVTVEYRTFPSGDDPCASSDDTSQISARTWRSGSSGLVPDDDRLLASSVPDGSGGNRWPQYELQGFNLALGESGTAAVTTVNASATKSVSLHVREGSDAAANPSPTPSTTVTAAPTTTVTATPAPTVAATPAPPPLVAKHLVAPRAVTGRHPTETVECPAAVGSPCSVTLLLSAGHARRLGAGRATIPAGKHQKVRITLTRAGRRAVGRRRVTARLLVTVTAGGRRSIATLKVKVGR